MSTSFDVTLSWSTWKLQGVPWRQCEFWLCRIKLVMTWWTITRLHKHIRNFKIMIDRIFLKGSFHEFTAMCLFSSLIWRFTDVKKKWSVQDHAHILYFWLSVKRASTTNVGFFERSPASCRRWKILSHEWQLRRANHLDLTWHQQDV